MLINRGFSIPGFNIVISAEKLPARKTNKVRTTLTTGEAYTAKNNDTATKMDI